MKISILAACLALTACGPAFTDAAEPLDRLPDDDASAPDARADAATTGEGSDEASAHDAGSEADASTPDAAPDTSPDAASLDASAPDTAPPPPPIDLCCNAEGQPHFACQTGVWWECSAAADECYLATSADCPVGTSCTYVAGASRVFGVVGACE